jgi:hypothetical protein
MPIFRPNLKSLPQVVALAAAMSAPALAQISITSPSFTYTNNFNSLATSGSPTWTDNSTMAGWYAARRVGSVNTPFTSYTANNGSSATGALYSYGTGTATDRALGSIADISGATTIAYGVRFRNNTGTTLTRLSIGFTGEQWRQAAGGGSANHNLTVSYRIASTVTTPDPRNSLTWTSVGSLTFNTPQDARTGSALDGNSAANRVELFLANISISLPNNSEIFIRWVDTANTGNDHGVAIDDVRIYVPEAGVVGPLTLVAFAAGHTWLKRRRLNRKSVASTGATPVDAPRTPAGH